MQHSAPQVIAYYLPQYHPIPENDRWWGPGFTEWTNTARARPLFPGHYQPHVPADLGYYDLRLSESREAQADLARAYGIEGFCYYHYWFGAGRKLLQRPLDEVIQSGRPDFPFCCCWANETWTGIWHGLESQVLVEQTYPGRDDETRHFESLLPAFADRRYIKVDGRLLFLVYNPLDLPDPVAFTTHWRKLARDSGLPDFHFVGVENPPWRPVDSGFDGATTHNLHLARHADGGWLGSRVRHHARRILGWPIKLYSYEKAIRHLLVDECSGENIYPCAIPNWDNTPRSGTRGLVLHDSTPERFRTHLRAVIAQVTRKAPSHQLIFLKSWNEWAEGNHLEPDFKFGHAYLEVVRDELAAARRPIT